MRGGAKTLINKLAKAGIDTALFDEVALALRAGEEARQKLEARRVGERKRKARSRDRVGHVTFKENAEKSMGKKIGHVPVTGQGLVLPFPSPASPPLSPPQTPPLISPTPPLPLLHSTDNLGARAKPKTAWREGQEVSDRWLLWAMAEKGWTRRQAQLEAERFTDSAVAHRRVYADWFAAWRNWCRSQFQQTVGPEKEPLTL